jgi:hypothetical protein
MIECVWKGEAYGPAPDYKSLLGPWEVGWCFFWGYQLSEHYKNNVAQIRKPISVMVPTRDGRGTPFCIDSHPTDKPDGNWQVTVDLDSLVIGQKPLITVTPSIHCVGLYHGHLTEGVLTGDVG